MAHRSDDWLIANVHNTARYFTEHPHIAWMTLVATLIWGIVGYLRMPQRKDPDIPVKVAMAICRWPGVEAEPGGAARRPADRGDDGGERHGQGADLDLAARRDVRAGHAQGGGGRPGQGVRRHQAPPRRHHRPAAGGPAGRVHPGLRLDRGADAHGGEPQGERGGGLAQGRGDRGRHPPRARGGGRRRWARHPGLRLPRHRAGGHDQAGGGPVHRGRDSLRRVPRRAGDRGTRLRRRGRDHRPERQRHSRLHRGVRAPHAPRLGVPSRRLARGRGAGPRRRRAPD